MDIVKRGFKVEWKWFLTEVKMHADICLHVGRTGV